MTSSSPIRPYGDTTGDGMVQLSFTLPMPHSKVADGAALQLANKMGIDPALVVHSKAMGPDFTFFVVYGRVNHLVDPSKVQVVERDYAVVMGILVINTTLALIGNILSDVFYVLIDPRIRFS